MIFPFVVVALLVSGAWVRHNQRNPYECGSSHPKVVACASYIQLAELRVSHYFLVHTSSVLLASCFIFLGMGLPSVGGIYKVARCILTKVSKSWVGMTNNYSRSGGFMALLLLWSLVLHISSFAIERVRVDEIEKGKLGEVKG
jgi:hypothetical protein